MLVGHKVLVFQSRCVTRASFDQPAESTALQVIDPADVVFIIKAECIAHQNEMHFLIVLHLDSVDTVDAREERLRVSFEVLVEAWEHSLNQF